MVFQKGELCNSRLDIRVSANDKARLKEFADKVNLPISALIRLAVNEFEKKINEKK